MVHFESTFIWIIIQVPLFSCKLLHENLSHENLIKCRDQSTQVWESWYVCWYKWADMVPEFLHNYLWSEWVSQLHTYAVMPWGSLLKIIWLDESMNERGIWGSIVHITLSWDISLRKLDWCKCNGRLHIEYPVMYLPALFNWLRLASFLCSFQWLMWQDWWFVLWPKGKMFVRKT